MMMAAQALPLIAAAAALLLRAGICCGRESPIIIVGPKENPLSEERGSSVGPVTLGRRGPKRCINPRACDVSVTVGRRGDVTFDLRGSERPSFMGGGSGEEPRQDIGFR
jgi:hypothetical protein